MKVLLNDGRNKRAREASDSGLGWVCVGVMVLLRLMAGGWVGKKAQVERAGAKGEDWGGRRDWDGASLSPRLSGHPDAAPLRGCQCR